jgi:hypothetical protein
MSAGELLAELRNRDPSIQNTAYSPIRHQAMR